MNNNQEKEYNIWNSYKKNIQDVDPLGITFSEREIWWCALGKNIGDEEDGKNELFERPVLILRKFSKNTAIILPLTTKGKTELPFYYKLATDDQSFVILSQIRLVSSKRFLRKIYKLGRGEFGNIQNKLKELIF